MWFLNRSDTNRFKHRRWLEAEKFGFRKKRNCTIRVAKTKALISFVITAKLICVFVFAYANCWFSHEAAHMFTNEVTKDSFSYDYISKYHYESIGTPFCFSNINKKLFYFYCICSMPTM